MNGSRQAEGQYYGFVVTRKAAASNWQVGTARDLPLVERGEWDGDAAKAQIFAWAGFDGDNPDPAKARRGFLAYDASEPMLRGSYKFPIAIVEGGRLVVPTSALGPAARRLPQSDLPGAVKDRARAVLDGYYAKREKAEPKKHSQKSIARVEKGGPGSGNWGHKGVPGQRGGSAPGSGGALTGATLDPMGTSFTWVDEETIKGEAVVEFSGNGDDISDDELTAYLKGQMAESEDLMLGSSDDIEEIEIKSRQNGSGYIVVKFEALPSEQAGQDWVNFETGMEERGSWR